MTRVRVLALVDWFLPGEKAGGPVRTLVALMQRLSAEVEFRVLTRDRDLGDDQPYPRVRSHTWYGLGSGACRYLGPQELGPRTVGRLLRSTPHDVLYINTLYSGVFCLYPLVLGRLRLVPRRPVVVAPRGQLNPGALSIRRRKKTFYLRLARVMTVFSGVEWQAASHAEAAEVRQWFGQSAVVSVAPDLRVPVPAPELVARREGSVRAVFLSRISPMKNLHGALKILAPALAPLHLDIYGPIEDAGYWERCRALIDELPAHVTARHQGIAPGAQVPTLLAGYDVLLLPTLGESYGHVIAEALAAGCPPLISDRTPWRDLQAAGAGWDLSLDSPERFTTVLEQLAAETPDRTQERRRRAVALAAAHDSDPAAELANLRLFSRSAS